MPIINLKLEKLNKINHETFRDKYFKNEMYLLDTYDDCILSSEINPCSSLWKGIEEDCEIKCIKEHWKSHFM